MGKNTFELRERDHHCRIVARSDCNYWVPGRKDGDPPHFVYKLPRRNASYRRLCTYLNSELQLRPEERHAVTMIVRDGQAGTDKEVCMVVHAIEEAGTAYNVSFAPAPRDGDDGGGGEGDSDDDDDEVQERPARRRRVETARAIPDDDAMAQAAARAVGLAETESEGSLSDVVLTPSVAEVPGPRAPAVTFESRIAGFVYHVGIRVEDEVFHYVGSTARMTHLPPSRIESHVSTDVAAGCCKLLPCALRNRPRNVELLEVCSVPRAGGTSEHLLTDAEHRKTVELFETLGTRNVRGGVFCNRPFGEQLAEEYRNLYRSCTNRDYRTGLPM